MSKGKFPQPKGFSDLAIYLEDGIYDSLFGDGWYEKDSGVGQGADELEDFIDTFKVKLCELFGHYVIMDGCGLSKHDYCLMCRKLVPGEAIQRKDSVA